MTSCVARSTKFYYTIRELSNHAAELFALRSIQAGELVRGDPYFIPQPGYGHDWDEHGGAAWLKQHLVTDYNACWQQKLGDGEWDAAVCDVGTSRWFNYYVNGRDSLSRVEPTRPTAPPRSCSPALVAVLRHLPDAISTDLAFESTCPCALPCSALVDLAGATHRRHLLRRHQL
jgi:hypothetical protein